MPVVHEPSIAEAAEQDIAFIRGAVMSKQIISTKLEPNEEGWPIFELWQKYEDIAMHFNDLLIKLRTQALAAVAALTTVIGVFAKSGADPTTSWQIVAFAFAILLLFGLAVWVLDFWYYNPLLIGAVVALYEIETASKTKLRIREINMSTYIEASVGGKLGKATKNWPLIRGRWIFYSLVLLALVGGLGVSLCQVAHAPTVMKAEAKEDKIVAKPTLSPPPSPAPAPSR